MLLEIFWCGVVLVCYVDGEFVLVGFVVDKIY